MILKWSARALHFALMPAGAAADQICMERAILPPQTEIQFLISLLHISSPGQPNVEQTRAIEQLLPAVPGR